MKKESENQPKNTSVMEHNQAIEYIQSVFPGCNYRFDDNCIESFGNVVQDKKIIHSYVWYNKLAIEIDDKTVYWPIRPYKMMDHEGRESSHFDKFKSY
jgi:hypothetical protein